MTPPQTVSAGTIRALLGLLLAAAVAAGVLGVNDSPLLPTTHADGVKYLSAATSLAKGGNLADPVARWSSPEESRFLAHFPPGYPLTLTGLIPRYSKGCVRSRTPDIEIVHLGADVSSDLSIAASTT